MEVKEMLAHPSNFTKGRKQKIQYIVVHYTANNGDTAEGNGKYFSGADRNTSAHYFVDESNKAYYESPMFGRLIHYLQNNARRVRIREKSGKRSFAISQVGRVEEAVEILSSILALDPV